MPNYRNPENDVNAGLARCYIASKAGGVVLPHIIDIHPVSGTCNLDCRWCIGKSSRRKSKSLPNLLNKTNILEILGKILEPRWKRLWPSEFHFCGYDSEPLLADSVLPAIDFLFQHERIIGLITNGLLLDRRELIPIVAHLNKLRISLDVTNDSEYKNFKYPKNHLHDSGYSKILNNLRGIMSYRNEINSDLYVSVTFVATPKTYEKNKWKSCFQELEDIGVHEIRVRDDLNETFGPRIENLASDIEEINKNIDGINVRFVSPVEPYSKFPYCRGARLWPTLASDGCLYHCAHTASSKYKPFGDLLDAKSLFELYTQLFQPPKIGFFSKEDIKCNRLCPSTIGSFNEHSLVECNLGKMVYV